MPAPGVAARRPAARKTVGTIVASPAPRHAKPRCDDGVAERERDASPAAASTPARRVSPTGPQRTVSRSPTTRPSVIVAANAAKPTAASDSPVPTDSSR